MEFVVWCWSYDLRCVLLVVCGVPTCCVLFVDRCVLFVGYCVLSLVVACFVMFIVCVCCCSFVAR